MDIEELRAQDGFKLTIRLLDDSVEDTENETSKNILMAKVLIADAGSITGNVEKRNKPVDTWDASKVMFMFNMFNNS